jgi:hypothetical protein
MAELADLASPDELSYKRRRNGAPSDSERTDRAGVPAKPAVPAPGTSAASMRISFFGDRLEATAVLLNQEDVCRPRIKPAKRWIACKTQTKSKIVLSADLRK